MDIAYDILAIIGVFSFAISGGLTAIQNRFDVFGILIIAFATAAGGGTIRDLVIGREAFWLVHPIYIYCMIAGTVFSILFRKKLEYLRSTLLFFDTIGLGLFTIVGFEIGVSYEFSSISCIALAVLTGVFGGIMRDVLVNDIPVIFRKEVYASISIAGASLYLLLRMTNLDEYINKLISIFFIIILRFIVIRFEISIPSFYKNEEETPEV